MELIQYIIIGILISIPIGPTTIISLYRTVLYGFKSGLSASLGLITSDFIYSLLFITNYTFIKDFSLQYQSLQTIISVIIFLIIAYTILKNNYRINKPNLNMSNLRIYLFILISALVNPISLLIFISLNSTDILKENAILFPLGIVIGELLYWSIINFFFLKIGKIFLKRFLNKLNIFIGIILIIFSIYLLLKLFSS